MNENKQGSNDQLTPGNSHYPAQPSTQSRLWIRLLLTSVLFVSGVVVGTCGALLFIRQQVHDRIHHPEQMPARVAAYLDRKLDLSDEQTLQVEGIVSERQLAIQAIRREFQPKLEFELQQLADQVSGLLDANQRAVWQERFDALRSQWLPTLPAQSDEEVSEEDNDEDNEEGNEEDNDEDI